MAVAMADVRIYKPAKTAMQSGRANTKQWLLAFEPTAPRTVDRLMGWTSSPDTRQQVRLRFDNLDAAIAYAKRNGLSYRVQQPREPRLHLKTYADNFRYDRVS